MIDIVMWVAMVLFVAFWAWRVRVWRRETWEINMDEAGWATGDAGWPVGTLEMSGDAPPECPICGRPLIRSSDATAGGAVLGTSLSWVCPEHGAFLVQETVA